MASGGEGYLGLHAKEALPTTKRRQESLFSGSFSHLSSSILQMRETEARMGKPLALGYLESPGLEPGLLGA